MTLPVVLAQPVLYGGLGGHGVSGGPQASINDGALVIVSQADGSTTLVGPSRRGRANLGPGVRVGRRTVRSHAGCVVGSRLRPDQSIRPATLIRINPDTGALISSVPIVDEATPLSIADLAVHPTTGVLYGTGGVGGARMNGAGKLYIINTTSGAAKLIGDTGKFFASIAFAADGTLYMSAADLGA